MPVKSLASRVEARRLEMTLDPSGMDIGSLCLVCEEIIEVTMHSYHQQPLGLNLLSVSYILLCEFGLFLYFWLTLHLHNILLQLQITVTSSSCKVIFVLVLAWIQIGMWCFVECKLPASQSSRSPI